MQNEDSEFYYAHIEEGYSLKVVLLAGGSERHGRFFEGSADFPYVSPFKFLEQIVSLNCSIQLIYIYLYTK